MYPMNLKETRIDNFKVYYRNRLELFRIKQEVFRDREYKFISENKTPFIIDCGCHIGLSIIYFKGLYPEAEILGFEPNPENFEILKKNIKVNKFTNVKVINAALSDTNGEDYLRISIRKERPWTWKDTIINNMWGNEEKNKKIKVRTVKLSTYVAKPVDLLKLDIEGSEQIVLREIEEKLPLIKRINMEFHSTPSSRDINNFTIVEELLRRNSFNVKIQRKSNIFAFANFVKHLRKANENFSIHASRD
jgi:FkbM family methyltransferase